MFIKLYSALSCLLTRGGMAVLFLLAACQLPATAPSWWGARGILVTGADPDDFAVANQGQVKHIAQQAYLEMELRFPGGAGSEIESMVTGWDTVITAPALPAHQTDDFAAVNQGQAKMVAEAFYDRLYDIGVRRPSGQKYPWLDTPVNVPDDFALANVGQIKFLFSFVIPVSLPAGGFLDTDTDGLHDPWEHWYFGNTTTADASSNSDGDLWSDLEEYSLGARPDVASQSAGLVIFTP